MMSRCYEWQRVGVPCSSQHRETWAPVSASSQLDELPTQASSSSCSSSQPCHQPCLLHNTHTYRPMSVVAKRLDGSRCHVLGREVVIGPGNTVLNGDQVVRVLDLRLDRCEFDSQRVTIILDGWLSLGGQTTSVFQQAISSQPPTLSRMGNK